jgi:tRNA(Ile)-lysidine synthetase-like protein
MKNSLVACPPWKGGGKHIESLVRKAILQFSLIEEDKIAVALSGGKDSLCLLYMLHAINNHGVNPFQLAALHVEGAFSCGAKVQNNFLQKICEELKIPLFVKKLENTSEDSLDCYSCSRMRRKLLFELAHENQFSTIAFGHHREDMNQTLLMNLFQKGEFATMLPKIYMHHYKITIIRPLIYVSEEMIKKFADFYGFLRITCQCPKGQISNRRSTEELIGQIEKKFPHARKNLSNAAFTYGSKKSLDL